MAGMGTMLPDKPATTCHQAEYGRVDGMDAALPSRCIGRGVEGIAEVRGIGGLLYLAASTCQSGGVAFTTDSKEDSS